MTIKLYSMSCERNKLNKASYITLLSTLTGTIREQTSLINPVLTIEFDADGIDLTINKANYVKIDDFKRYYFVVDKTFVSHKIWRFTLKIDVLYTYLDEIKNTNCLIARNQSTTNPLILDKMESFSTKDTKAITLFTGQTTPFEWESDTGKGTTLIQLYFVSIIGDPTTTDYVANTSGVLSFPALPRAGTNLMGNTFSLLMYYDDVKKLVAFARTNDLMSFIVNVSVIPLTNTRLRQQFTDDTAQVVGTGIPIGGKIYTTLKQSWIVSKFPYLYAYTLTKTESPDTYKLYEPVSTYQIYVPFVGYIDVSASDIINKKVDITYTFEPVGGSSYVRVTNPSRVIYSGACQLGTNLIISNDNSYQNEVLKRQTTLNMVTGTIGGVTNIAGGVMSGNILATIKGSNSLLTSTLSGYQTLSTIHQKASATITSGNAGNTVYLTAFLLRTYKESLLNTSAKITKFRALYGAPLNDYYDIKDLYGFTQVQECHLENFTNATSGELDEIESILKEGFII